MCGIFGIFGKEHAVGHALRGIERIHARGSDGYGVCTESGAVTTTHYDEFLKTAPSLVGNNALAHNLFCMVGEVIQPLVAKTRFAMNGEIYNWESLNKTHALTGRNDAEAFFQLYQKKGVAALDELDGVYAFVYWDKEVITFGRDLLGVKPLWYVHKGTMLCVASERKALLEYGDGIEVDPQKIYTFQNGELTTTDRAFFEITETNDSKEQMIETLKQHLIDAVRKRVDRKVGILFSGGIDSTLLALIAKQQGYDVMLYSACFADGDTKEAEDSVWAHKVAAALELPLKETVATLEQTEVAVPKIIETIEEPSVVKVGVALPFYFCCQQAQHDGIRLLLSGLGSEEIFAGYQRHEKSDDINDECLAGLKQIHERDLYRDDVITLHNKLDLRLPFLDHQLVRYALSIPAEYKIIDDVKKVILREAAVSLGLPKEIAFRKKRAAQYGSNFDKALAKLAKKGGFHKKKAYLESKGKK